jgi:hypothetical protein
MYITAHFLIFLCRGRYFFHPGFFFVPGNDFFNTELLRFLLHLSLLFDKDQIFIQVMFKNLNPAGSI